MNLFYRHSRAGALVAGLLYLLSSAATVSQAGPISLTLDIAETQAVAQDPTNMAAAMMAAWQSQHVLMVQRRMPYINITLDDLLATSPTAELKSLQIKIGHATQYSFDLASIVASSPGINITLGPGSPTGTLGAFASDTITLNFSNFTKGEEVLLQTNLVSDPPNTNLFPDYRYVLFDMNGNNPNDNAIFIATFQDGSETTTGQVLLPDFTMLYQTNSGVGFRSAYSMDHVQAFSANIDPILAPEPSSIVLGMLGAFGMGTAVWRRRRLSPLAPGQAA